jgi:hypothetical protein
MTTNTDVLIIGAGPTGSMPARRTKDACLAEGTNEVRRLQHAIAAVFLILGGWCLVWPSSVIALTVRPDYQTDHLLALVSLGAFGAQAVLAGLFAAFSQFTRVTFAAFGIAILPFFVFDWWFYAVVPLFNELILLDALGNVIFIAICARGYFILRRRAA